MRKLLIKMVLSIGFLMMTVGCFQINNTPVTPKNSEEANAPMTLSRRIMLTPVDGSIDMATDVETVEKGETVTVSRSMQIESSSESRFNMQGMKLSVTVTKVVLKNLKNISEIIVQPSAENTFTLENCSVSSLTLYGAGSSIRLINSEIERLNVVYENANVSFDEETKVSVLYVAKDCKLTAEDNDSVVDTALVDSGVKMVKLFGGMTINKLVTRTKVNTNVAAIEVNSSDVEIEKSGGIYSNGLLYDVTFALASEEINFSTPTSMGKPEITEVEAIADAVPLPSPESESQSSTISKDNPGRLTLSSSTGGIQIKSTIPEKINMVSFYRAEYGSSTWYCIGSCLTESGEALPSTVKFLDYYVEKGKTYQYYALYRMQTNDTKFEKSETDILSAVRGAGVLKLTSSLTLHYDEKLHFIMEGNAKFSNTHSPELTEQVGFYFKKVGENTTGTIVEPANYTYVSINEDGVPYIQILSSLYFDTALEPVGVSASLSRTEGNLRTVWQSLPSSMTAGRGFKKGRITISESAVPMEIAQALKGLLISVSPDRIFASESVNKIAVLVGRTYDSCMISLCPPDSLDSSLDAASYTFTESSLSSAETEKITCAFQKYDASEATYTTLAEICMYAKAKKSGYSPVVSKTLSLSAYNPHSLTAYIPQSVDKWFTRTTVIPETYTVTVDENEIVLPCTESKLSVSYHNRDYSVKKDVDFNQLTIGEQDVYVSNFFCQFSGTQKTECYPYGMQAFVAYKNNSLKVEYIPFRTSYAYLPGMPEKYTWKDVYTEKTGEIAGGGIFAFSNVQSNTAAVTISIPNAIGSSIEYAGTVDFLTNTITASAASVPRISWCFALADDTMMVLASRTATNVFVRIDSGSEIKGSTWQLGDSSAWQYRFDVNSDNTNSYTYVRDNVAWSKGTWNAAEDTVTITPNQEYLPQRIFPIFGSLLLVDEL
ncbi:MAG: hypothetical protein IJS09_06460 [Treponema sp.]|nr:hypothetical protein [Treponema sp.]